jgi:hypothetical protein
MRFSNYEAGIDHRELQNWPYRQKLGRTLGNAGVQSFEASDRVDLRQIDLIEALATRTKADEAGVNRLARARIDRVHVPVENESAHVSRCVGREDLVGGAQRDLGDDPGVQAPTLRQRSRCRRDLPRRLGVLVGADRWDNVEARKSYSTTSCFDSGT